MTELFVFSLSLLERGIYEKSVCNFQSMKSPLELNGVLSKFFCFITWLLYQLIRRNTTTCKQGLYVKSYCFFETITVKNYKLKYFIAEGAFKWGGTFIKINNTWWSEWFSTICTVLKTRKHPWRSVTLSKAASFSLQLYEK